MAWPNSFFAPQWCMGLPQEISIGNTWWQGASTELCHVFLALAVQIKAWFCIPPIALLFLSIAPDLSQHTRKITLDIQISHSCTNVTLVLPILFLIHFLNLDLWRWCFLVMRSFGPALFHWHIFSVSWLLTEEVNKLSLLAQFWLS